MPDLQTRVFEQLLVLELLSHVCVYPSESRSRTGPGEVVLDFSNILVRSLHNSQREALFTPPPFTALHLWEVRLSRGVGSFNREQHC